MESGPEKRHRGKLYVLTGERSAWEDKGTGVVSIIAADEGKKLIVRDEHVADVLLHDRPVLQSDSYRLQGDAAEKSIIVWEDAGIDLDCALSFQDAQSAQQIYSELCGDNAKKLPFPEVQHLPELARLLTFVLPSQKEAIANECLDERFIAALRQVFHTAEDCYNPQDLIWLWRIARGVFMLANHALTRRYLRHDIFEDTMGMLEFDEGIPEDRRICHRHVLKESVHYKQVLSFQDEELLERIHLNYRLQYLKDHVLARVLDDAAFGSLTQLVIMNNSYLLNYLQQNDALLQQLFDGLKKKDILSLLFLQDACRLAKTMPPGERKLLLDKMLQQQLYPVLLQFLQEEPTPKDGTEGPVPRHMAMEVLVSTALTDAAHLRRYLLVSGPEGSLFLQNLMCLLMGDPDNGVQSQVADILQLVMDPTQITQKSRATFLDALYANNLMDLIAKPLVDLSTSNGHRSRLSTSGVYAIQTICELLAFAVAHHGRRPETLITSNNLASKAIRVARSATQRYLLLAPIRLVKAMVSAEDHMYLFHMIDAGIFGSILEIIEESYKPPYMGGGMLASSAIELFETIRMQNAKPLIKDICTTYEGLLRRLAPVFKVAGALLARHEVNLEEAEKMMRRPSNTLRRMAGQLSEGAEEVLLRGEAQDDAPTVELVEDDVAGKDFSQIFGADASSDDDSGNDDSDSTDQADEDEEEEHAEEDEEERGSSDESNEASPAEASQASTSTGSNGSVALEQPVTSNAQTEGSGVSSTSSAEVAEVEDEAASGAKPQVKPRRGLNPPISRLQASRCRHFIASSTQPKVTLQRRKEDLNGRHSLSHASKRPRKETPAIPA